ncbi:MAG: efflux RND transporter periplasmic adaptor subunit [Planctomycetaceae bacterium]
MRLNSHGVVATCIVMCLFFSGCDARIQQDGAGKESSAAALPKVATSKPVRKTLIQKTIQPGKIEAFSTTPIHAKIGGYVDLVKVDIGDRVTGPKRDAEGRITEPGQTLAVLTAPEVEEELHQKQAMVEQVTAEVLQAEAAVKVAESMLVSAKAGVEEHVAGQQRATAQYERWKSEFDRMKTLSDAKTVTPKLMEEAELQFKSADASRSESNARVKSAEAAMHEASVSIQKAQADVQAEKSHLRVAEADRDRVSALRDYLQITAPFDGIITERRIDPGHLVQPSRSAADTPLFVLVQADTVRLFVDVPEADAGLVENGRPAKITISAQSNMSIDGTVARTGWALQSGTRALRCEIDVPNSDGHLRPGMYAQVELTVAERPDVLSVPKTAIVTKDGQSFCVTVTSDGSILRKPVQTGIRSATDVEITSGLDGTEDILTANAAAFTDGQMVEKATAK